MLRVVGERPAGIAIYVEHALHLADLSATLALLRQHTKRSSQIWQPRLPGTGSLNLLQHLARQTQRRAL